MAETSENLGFILPDNGEFENNWDVPVNENFGILDLLFAATGGHLHDGTAGQGSKIPHANLTGIGVNTHTQIDAHIADTALHSDEMIGEVSDEELSTQVTEVSTLRFANSTITDLGGGVVLVSPNILPPSNTVAQTAPSVAYDNFTAPVGVPISTRCWRSTKNSATAPEYFINNSMDNTMGAEMTVVRATDASGFYTGLFRNLAPHSWNQRVTVTVNKYGPTAGSGSPNAADTWTLWLHLLASDRVAGSHNAPARPLESGLSLRLHAAYNGTEHTITAAFMALNQSATVMYQETFPAPSGWSHPETSTLGWTDLPLTYLVGDHEFAISQDEATSAHFILHYYYEGGLIYQKTFTAADGAFYTAVRDIIDSYQGLISPSVPDYGRVGFSTSYDLAASGATTFSFKLGCVAAASVRDIFNTRTVSYPSSPYTYGNSAVNITAQGEILNPPAVQVCAGAAPWTGLIVGGGFDPDGAGPETFGSWTIRNVVAATGTLSEGFYVSRTASNTDGFTVYCAEPVTTNPMPTNPFVRPGAPEVSVFHGDNLPVSQFSAVNFYAAEDDVIPTDWTNGDLAGTYYQAGDLLPTSFIQNTALTQTVTSSGTVQYALTTAGGLRIPWGATIDVEVIPEYTGDTDYEALFSGLLSVRAGVPQTQQLLVYQYDPNTFAGSGWGPVDETNPVHEYAYVLVVYVGSNTPLGPNFWTGGNTFGSYGLADTIGPSGTTGAGVSIFADSPAYRPTVYHSVITKGMLSASPGVQGLPPASVIVDPTTPSGVTFSTDPAEYEVVASVIRLHPRAWDGASASRVSLRLRDTLSGLNFPQVELVSANDILPAVPVILPTSTISSTVASTATTITLIVTVPDTDMIVTPVSGLTGSPVIRTSNNVTITGDAAQEQWVITGWTVSASVGAVIEVSVENAAAEAQHPGLGSATRIMGVVGGGTVLTPSVTYLSGQPKEDETALVYIELLTSSLDQAGALTVVEIPAGGNTEFFTVSTYKVQDIDDGPTHQTWAVPIETRDVTGGGALPSTMTLRIRNIQSNTYTDLTGITVKAASAPTIASASVNGPASGITTWKNSDPTVKLVYIAINDTTPPKLTVRPFRRRSGVNTYLANGSAYPNAYASNMYTISVVGPTLTDASNGNLSYVDLVAGDTIGFEASNLTAGDPLVDTENAMFTITQGVNINGSNHVVNPRAGHYSTFDIRGYFHPVGVSGANITLAFVDQGNGSGVSVLHPSNSTPLMDVVSPTKLTGSIRFAADSAGKPIYVKITHAGGGTYYRATGQTVGAAPAPVITGVSFSSLYEGTNSVSVNITGQNLIPPTKPTGQPTLSYTYTFIDDWAGGTTVGSPVLNGGTATSTNLDFTLNIAAATAGTNIGLQIGYLGASSFEQMPIATVLAAPAGDPLVTLVEASNNFATTPTTNPVYADPDTNIQIRITGSNLGTNNIQSSGTLNGFGVVLTVCGSEDGAGFSSALDSPPGCGILAQYGRSVIPTTLISQTPTQIVCQAYSVGNALGNTRLRVHLLGADSGATEWPQDDIDDTDIADAGGLKHLGLTFPVLARPGQFRVNTDPDAGITKLDIARTVQGLCGPGTEGDSISFTVRTNTAMKPPGTVPAVQSVPDPVYGTKFTITSIVASVSSDFEFTINGTLPNPGVGNTYPLEEWDPEAAPTWIQIQFVAGAVPIVAALLGESDWIAPAGDATDNVVVSP